MAVYDHHLTSTDLVQTLAFSLILSRLDYCNALLHSAPASSIQKLEHVQSVCQDCSVGAKAIQLHATTVSAPLAANPTVDDIQVTEVSHADVKILTTNHTCLPPPSHHSAHLWMHSAIPWPARRSSSQNVGIRRTCILLCRTFGLECSS